MTEPDTAAAPATSYTVGQVASFAGVTVRTLHHYDEIGLLTPSERSGAGYRCYAPDDLARLQRILFYRELGFGLAEIATILDDPDADPLDHLRRQHGLVTGQAQRLRELARTLEKTMEAHAMGIRLTPEEMFDVFGDVDPTEHVAETEQRWGDTAAYRESARRTSTYTKDDWLRIRAEADAITQSFAVAMQGGRPAESAEALAAARAHRAHIAATYYSLTPQLHRGLGEMYVADERFTRTYDDVAAGLARYVRDAIVLAAEQDAEPA
jgi:MerR family transcriptional regulator, thiopeptide resistance regulator